MERKVGGGRRRLWVEGFLACSLDMGQEINGTSNTNANSVSRAAHTAHAYNSQPHAGMLGIGIDPIEGTSPLFFARLEQDWKVEFAQREDPMETED